MPVSPTQPPFRLFAQSFDIKLARILQVARQSLRTATRSRFAASLAALLALVALALPSLVPGDGSPEGDMRILLAWAPGLATMSQIIHGVLNLTVKPYCLFSGKLLSKLLLG